MRKKRKKKRRNSVTGSESGPSACQGTGFLAAQPKLRHYRPWPGEMAYSCQLRRDNSVPLVVRNLLLRQKPIRDGSVVAGTPGERCTGDRLGLFLDVMPGAKLSTISIEHNRAGPPGTRLVNGVVGSRLGAAFI